MNYLKNWIILGAATLFLVAAPIALSYPAKVIGVTDGDTVKVLVDGKKQVKIRLAEIDTPEKRQPWGKRAKQALSELVFGKVVDVRPVTKDRYGRTVAHLFLNSDNINLQMVITGNAWAYRRYVDDHSILDAEKKAKREGLGLWSLPATDRVPPWEWRRKKKRL
ncbi:MAG: thermonuclease family protein [Sedimenticola sp.]